MQSFLPVIVFNFVHILQPNSYRTISHPEQHLRRISYRTTDERLIDYRLQSTNMWKTSAICDRINGKMPAPKNNCWHSFNDAGGSQNDFFIKMFDIEK